jgi:predicted thioesterase
MNQGEMEFETTPTGLTIKRPPEMSDELWQKMSEGLKTVFATGMRVIVFENTLRRALNDMLPETGLAKEPLN